MRYKRAGPEAYLACMQGGGMPVYAGAPYQRGHGIGGIFKSVAKMALPLLKKGMPFLKKTAKNVIRAKMKGVPMKEIVKQQGPDVVGELLGNMMGQRRGYKRKKRQPVARRKRVKAKDIFS